MSSGASLTQNTQTGRSKMIETISGAEIEGKAKHALSMWGGGGGFGLPMIGLYLPNKTLFFPLNLSHSLLHYLYA